MAGARIAQARQPQASPPQWTPNLHEFPPELEMPGTSTLPGQPPKPLMPAWVFSVIIHAAAVGALCYAYHPSPRGAGDAHHGSIGIVLSHSSSGGDTSGKK